MLFQISTCVLVGRDADSKVNMRPRLKRCCFKSQHASSLEKMLFQKSTCVLAGKDAVSKVNMRPRWKRCCFKNQHAPSLEKMLFQKSTCALAEKDAVSCHNMLPRAIFFLTARCQSSLYVNSKNNFFGSSISSINWFVNLTASAPSATL